MSNNISTSFFNTFAKILVRVHLLFCSSTDETHCCIPLIRVSFCNTECMIGVNRGISLAKVLWLSKNVKCYRFKIFYCFLDDHSFWKSSIYSFRMKWKTSSSWKFFFCIPKSMFYLLNWPHVVSMLLLSWTKSSVSFIVHCRHFWSFLLFSTSWVKYIFCTFTSGGGNSKSKLVILYNFRQFMTSLIRFTKRLSLMALILHFLEIVVEISKSCEILSFDYLAHFFWISSWSTVLIIERPVILAI